jgi:hypothetical protein
MLARSSQAFHPLAVPGEDRNAQFLLEVDDRLGNTRLRRMQRPCGFRQAELVPGGLAEKAELLQVHRGLRRPVVIKKADFIQLLHMRWRKSAGVSPCTIRYRDCNVPRSLRCL